ncbi:hypothetical protein L6164_009850 [Bauhinia variegata]|uniref:Uncharacterized protein n=1 Tax=Bauhinia variegata TaxID=167791 RepID=A0ACB9PLA1_BAUVA|nr:hypothetical protein L6164_009850 [Bauhinia variegata]
MEGVKNQQQSNASVARVFELPGEPAIVINGVPDIIPSGSTIPFHNASSTVITQGNSNFGEWLEGREVLKLYRGQYYSGTVMEFDKESGWYRVLYEDGDSEDLDWKELEEVLLPLDVTVPLKTLAHKIVRRSKKAMHKSVQNVALSQNPQFKSKAINPALHKR